MSMKDWNFKQKPTGVWKHVLRLPTYLFRSHLGFLMGERILLLIHKGRVSGQLRQTAVEVVTHDRTTHEYIVCSGTGPGADWYLNITALPAVEVQVGNHRWTPTQRMVPQPEAAQRFADYERLHPKTARRLLKSMGNAYDGTDEGRLEMMARMPMVAFADRQRPSR
jgi:deazaflavin-dependent oxidoreductase (nitroreductase family)